MIEVSYVDHMGSDERVVDAARVSMAKRAEQFTPGQNRRLLAYLAEHQHWSPYAHCMLTVHVAAPIFVARQLQKHTVGLAWNEVSRRYVDDAPEVFTPDAWRGRPVTVKQGSSGALAAIGSADDVYRKAITEARIAYSYLLSVGVAPEQARMVLPLATLTEWFWTGSLAAWARVCHLRQAPDAQAETKAVADRIAVIAAEHFPISWAALRGWRPEASGTGDAA